MNEEDNYRKYYFSNEKHYLKFVSDITNRIVKNKDTHDIKVQKGIVDGYTIIIVPSICTETGMPAISISNFNKN